MRFRDVLSLPYDKQSGVVEVECLKAHLPETPYPVLLQVFSEHGRNPDFQERYGQIELTAIEWRKVTASAEAVCGASMNPDFVRWFENVTKRVNAFQEDGWSCIDSRDSVIRNWRLYSSWLTPPVFFSGEVVGLDSHYYLLEGHTRLGVLNGLLLNQIVSPASLHEFWLGGKASA